MNVPFVDLRAQNAQVKNEIMEMWEDIIDSAGFIGGKYVTQFEERFAQMCGTKHCVAVSSGTDALVVGFGFSIIKSAIIPAVAVIGLITFFLSFIGVFIGHRFGNLFQNKIEMIGGAILIVIGSKILLEHLTFIT